MEYLFLPGTVPGTWYLLTPPPTSVLSFLAGLLRVVEPYNTSGVPFWWGGLCDGDVKREGCGNRVPDPTRIADAPRCIAATVTTPIKREQTQID